MAVGIAKDDWMVRMAPDDGEAALKRKHTRPMDFTGKPMKGFLFVARKASAPRRCSKDGSIVASDSPHPATEKPKAKKPK